MSNNLVCFIFTIDELDDLGLDFLHVDENLAASKASAFAHKRRSLHARIERLVSSLG